MPLIPFLLLLSFSCFHISLCFLIFVFSSLFVAAYGASHCCWFESKLNWKPVCVSVRVTLKHWLISYCPGDKFAFLNCKLGERFVMFSEVICNMCFFRGGAGVNNSQVMLGLRTQEVSLGIWCGGYDRWYEVPPWLNLTSSLLWLHGSEARMCVCICADMFI